MHVTTIEPTTEAREHAIPIGTADSGTMIFTRGASNLTLRTTPDRDNVCRLAFRGGVPEVATTSTGRVEITYPRFFHPLDWRKHGIHATLTEALPWQMEVRGGVAHVDADFALLRLTAVTIEGGVSDVRLTLPSPRGVVPIRIAGGASNLELIRPAGIPMNVEIASGAGHLRIDDQHFGAMGGPISLHAGPDTRSPDRYELIVTAGVSRLTIREQGQG